MIFRSYLKILSSIRNEPTTIEKMLIFFNTMHDGEI